jgi:hypothetical protein
MRLDGYKMGKGRSEVSIEISMYPTLRFSLFKSATSCYRIISAHHILLQSGSYELSINLSSIVVLIRPFCDSVSSASLAPGSALTRFNLFPDLSQIPSS